MEEKKSEENTERWCRHNVEYAMVTEEMKSRKHANIRLISLLLFLGQAGSALQQQNKSDTTTTTDGQTINKRWRKSTGGWNSKKEDPQPEA